MMRLSVLSMLLLVVLFAMVLALFLRLREEAFCYVTGPILGAMFSTLAYQRDRSAFVAGGAVGGLCQGIFTVLVLKRGYIFADFGELSRAERPHEKGCGLEERVLELLAQGQVLTRTRLRDSLAVKNERLGDVLESLKRAGQVVRTSGGWRRHC
jgi:hypothetical protein